VRHCMNHTIESMDAPAHDLTTGCESAPSRTMRIATPTTVPRPRNVIMAAQLACTASDYGSDLDVGCTAALSDYGSDIGFDDIDEDTILANVLDVIRDNRPAEKGRVLPSIEFEAGEREDEAQNVDGSVHIHAPALLRVAKGQSGTVERAAQSSSLREREPPEVEYDERSWSTWSCMLSPSIHSYKSITGTLRLTTNSA
jgi:exonuclease V